MYLGGASPYKNFLSTPSPERGCFPARAPYGNGFRFFSFGSCFIFSSFISFSTEDPNCKIDLALVVDASGSVRDDWDVLLRFLTDVSGKLNPGPDGTHIGMVIFGDSAVKIFDFREFDEETYNEAEVFSKITKTDRPLPGERTFINRGLRLANLELLREQFGMRPDVRKVGSKTKARQIKTKLTARLVLLQQGNLFAVLQGLQSIWVLFKLDVTFGTSTMYNTQYIMSSSFVDFARSSGFKR